MILEGKINNLNMILNVELAFVAWILVLIFSIRGYGNKQVVERQHLLCGDNAQYRSVIRRDSYRLSSTEL